MEHPRWKVRVRPDPARVNCGNSSAEVSDRCGFGDIAVSAPDRGFNGVFLLPANLYGPGDNFDPRTSHVIPALIRKFDEALRSGASHVELWGDGTPTREFLYVDDAADGVLTAAERYESDLPLNLGTGDERTIAQVAKEIAARTGFTGEVRWDASRPSGQPRSKLDTSRAESEIGWHATTPFEVGLQRTIDWWRQRSS